MMKCNVKVVWALQDDNTYRAYMFRDFEIFGNKLAYDSSQLSCRGSKYLDGDMVRCLNRLAFEQ
jgi:hypothetical protein